MRIIIQRGRSTCTAISSRPVYAHLFITLKAPMLMMSRDSRIRLNNSVSSELRQAGSSASKR
jgi:hypothetical protein